MKKIAFLLLILFSTSINANAFVDNQYTSSEQFLVNIGYSKEAAKVLTIVNQDPYRENYSDNAPYSPLEIAKRAYHYLVPGVNTDYDFYNHSGDFNSTSWRDF